MFILHIDTGAEMRGGQWQAFYLIRELALCGHRVRLLARPGSPLLQAAVSQRIDARPLRLALLPRDAAQADLIHAHDARAHTLAVLLRKPVVVSRRVAFPVQSGVLSRWKYGRASHYIAVSEFVKHVLVEAGVSPDKITVVYDGVPADASPQKLPNRPQVLAVDSDDPGKGKKIIERAAALAGIPVHFSSQLLRDLPGAAAFVYITELEGLGSAALLAMAAGVPVLASRVGGLPEIVEDEVTGLLTSNEPEQVAKNMQRLLGDRPLAARLAASARTRVEREFSVDRMVNGTIRVYERMVK
ncbi:MAG TPA: glycosyltransferase family 4 protein [Bryobacteraceae bacterium]|nr:glycosyltransferase family 4 protein [Bryobacteraceae bacterium]